MNNEEKILEMLSKMQTQQEQMQAQMGTMQAQMGTMQAQMGTMQKRLDGIETRLDGIETRLDGIETRLDGIETRLDGVETRLDRAEENIHFIKGYLELDVEKRFDAVNEGIDVIQETLKEKFVPVERMEKAEDDIIVLKTSVKTLACDVAELKRAQ